MTSSIQQSIVTWNLVLNEIQSGQDAEARESPASRIRQIALNCFEIRNTQGVILDSDVTLSENLTRLEQRVNGLFLEYSHMGHVSDKDFAEFFKQAARGDGTTLRILLDTVREVRD